MGTVPECREPAPSPSLTGVTGGCAQDGIHPHTLELNLYNELELELEFVNELELEIFLQRKLELELRFELERQL